MSQTKQMLCLSVQRRKGELCIRFEREPFYPKLNRMHHTSVPLEVFDKEILLRNAEYKDKIAFGLILSLYIRNSADDKDMDMAHLLYPHLYNGNPVIRSDAEKYEFKSHREFCDELVLPSDNVDTTVKDKALIQLLAEKIFTHLPISKELCFDDK